MIKPRVKVLHLSPRDNDKEVEEKINSIIEYEIEGERKRVVDIKIESRVVFIIYEE